jgi:hypothetical protein
MDKDIRSKEVIPQTTRHGLLMMVFGVCGAIELWLWNIGQANRYGLYIGLAFIFGSALSAAQYIKYRKKA